MVQPAGRLFRYKNITIELFGEGEGHMRASSPALLSRAGDLTAVRSDE